MTTQSRPHTVVLIVGTRSRPVRCAIQNWKVVLWFGEKFQTQHIVISTCGDCFKESLQRLDALIAKWGNTDRGGSLWGSELGLTEPGKLAPRRDVRCYGCGETIHTIVNARNGYWNYCSNRCYQRSYRKRRRGQDSVVDWKGRRPNNTCATCKKLIDSYGEPRKRKDARYCSDACRQKEYRKRLKAAVSSMEARS